MAIGDDQGLVLGGLKQLIGIGQNPTVSLVFDVSLGRVHICRMQCCANVLEPNSVMSQRHGVDVYADGRLRLPAESYLPYAITWEIFWRDDRIRDIINPPDGHGV